MFYADNISETFRMGDVLKGFSEVLPIYNSPNKSNLYEFELNIKITQNEYYVILTPCCSIEQSEVVIVPLRKIDDKFLLSEYITKNFLIINRPMKRREMIGEIGFNKLSPEEQLEIENIHAQYEYLDKFIYGGHALLPEYEISRKRGKDDIIKIKTNNYMISFKDFIKIKSSIFNRENKNCVKYFELSPIARNDLRNKLSYFYSRIPSEDQPFLPQIIY